MPVIPGRGVVAGFVRGPRGNPQFQDNPPENKPLFTPPLTDAGTVVVSITPSTPTAAGATPALQTNGVGQVSSNSQVTSLSVPIGSGIQPGDVIFIVGAWNVTVAGSTFTTPAGFTPVSGVTDSGASPFVSVGTFYKIADGSEAGTNVNLAHSSTGRCAAVSAAFDNSNGLFDGTLPTETDDNGTAGGVTAPVSPSLTGLTTIDMAVLLLGCKQDTASATAVSFTPPSGYTVAVQQSGTSSAGNNGAAAIAYKMKSDTLDETSPTWATNLNVHYLSVSIPVQPVLGMVGEAAQFVDSGTVVVDIDPSGSNEIYTAGGTAYTDAETPVVDITPSAVETAQFVDSATVGLTITPSGVDTAQFVDASTALVAITPSATDTAQYVDAATVFVDIDNSASVETGIIHTDAATVSYAITPSGADTAQFVDSATVLVDIDNSASVETGIIHTDSATVGVVLTPSAAETAQFVEATTVRVTITPSAADIAAYVEVLTVTLAITPSSTEAGAYVDTGTVPVAITPSAADTAQFVDTATVPILIDASGTTESTGAGYVDSATAVVTITPSTPAVVGATVVKHFDSGSLTGTSTTTLITVPSGGVALGNTLLVFVDKNATAVVDSRGNTYTKDAGLTGAGTIMGIAVWRAPITTALINADTITITNPNQGGRAAIAVEVNGMLSSPVESSVTNTFDYNSTGQTSASFNGSAATTNPATMVFGAWTLDSNASSPVAGSGEFLEDSIASGGTVRTLAVEYKVLSATATPSTSLSWTGSSLAQTAALVAYDITAPLSSEFAQFVDTGTVTVAITPSAAETAQFVDSATVLVDLQNSAVEVGIEHTDTATVALAITPSSTDVAAYVEAATVLVSVTPSVVEGTVHTDSGTVPVALTPSAADTAQKVESGTVPLGITPSTSEFITHTYVDADTAAIFFTITDVTLTQFTESATVPLAITPTTTVEIKERAFLDSAEVDVIFTILGDEFIAKEEVVTVPMLIRPGLLSEFQGDGDIVRVAVTADVLEGFLYQDAEQPLVNLDVLSDEVGSFTTASEVRLSLIPATLEETAATIDSAVVGLLITPGAVVELRIVADYLLVGTVSNHYTAILRDTNYPTLLRDNQFAATLDSGWLTVWHGRGDE